MVLRIVLAVILAFVANMVVVGLGEFWMSLRFPPPRGALAGDAHMMAAFARSLPLQAFVILVVTWAAGAFAGAAVAYLVSGRIAIMAFVGALPNLLGVIFSVATLPHPLWVGVVGGLSPILAGVVIPLFAPRPRPAEA